MKSIYSVSKFILILFPITLFIVYYFGFRSQSPIVDDFWHIADFDVLLRSCTFSEKIKLLFIVRNSHICLPTYLLSFLQVLTFKEFNMHFMTFTGVLFLFLTIAIFNKASKHSNGSKMLLPLLLLSLTPQIYSIIFFPLVSLQVCITFFLGVLCSYILAYKASVKGFNWAVFLAILITFCNGNGMIIWPMGSILFLLNNNFSRKQLFVWLTVGVISIALYLMIYSTEKSQIGYFSFTPLYFIKVLVFNLSFLGNAFDFFPSLIFTESLDFGLTKKLVLLFRIILIIGFTATVILSYSKRILSYFRHQSAFSATTLFSLGVILYIVGSGFVGSIFRANEGYGIAVSPRYKYYGMMGLLSFVVLIGERTNRKQYKTLVWSAVIYFFASYVCYWSIGRDFTNQANASLLNISRGNSSYIHEPYGRELSYSLNNEIIPKIHQNHLFDFKKAESRLHKISNEVVINKGIIVSLKGEKIKISDITFLHKIKYDFMLSLESSDKKYILLPLSALPLIDYDSFSYNRDSYAAVYKHFIPDGSYELFLISSSINGRYRQMLNYKFVKKEEYIEILKIE